MYQITDEARLKLQNHLAQLPYYIAQPLLAFVESNVTPLIVPAEPTEVPEEVV